MILDIYAHVVAILKSNSLEALEASNTPRKKPLGKKRYARPFSSVTWVNVGKSHKTSH